MRYQPEKCSVCGSENFQLFGSVIRMSQTGNRKVPRYKCENGHRFTDEGIKKLCEQWVKHLAIRLRENNYNYRVIAIKIEAYIAETGIASTLGREKFTHTAIHKWIVDARVRTSKEKNKDAYVKFKKKLSNPEFKAIVKNHYEQGILEKNPIFRKFKDSLVSEYAAKALPEFQNLIKDSRQVSRLWCNFMMLEALTLMDEVTRKQINKAASDFFQEVRLWRRGVKGNKVEMPYSKFYKKLYRS